MSFFSRLTGVFTGSSTKSTTEKKPTTAPTPEPFGWLPYEQRELSKQFKPGPSVETAFSDLMRDPETFLRRNELKDVLTGDESGPSQLTFVKHPGVVGKRRSSVTGEDVPVYSYSIMSESGKKMWKLRRTQEEQDETRFHSFTGSVVPMDVVKDTPLSKPPERETPHETDIGDRPTIFATRPVTACSIVRRHSDLSHWKPVHSSHSPYGKGETLEKGIRDKYPEAKVHGPSQYKKHAPKSTLFMRSDIRGRVHIWGQDPPTKTDGYWSTTVRKTRLSDPESERERALRFMSDPRKQKLAQKTLLSSLDSVMERQRRILGMKDRE